MKNRFFTAVGFFVLLVFQNSCSSTSTVSSNSNSANANSSAVNQANVSNTSEIKPIPQAEIIDAKPHRNSLKTQSAAIGQAIKTGDFNKIADYTHPIVFEMAGGRERSIADGKKEFEEVTKDGFEIVSLTVGEPKDAVAVEKELFAVVPITIVTRERTKAESNKTGTFRSESTLIGISNDNGANWKFLSDMNQERFAALFPAAATKLRIPEDKIVPVAQR